MRVKKFQRTTVISINKKFNYYYYYYYYFPLEYLKRKLSVKQKAY
jgi:hypothetical protein